VIVAVFGGGGQVSASDQQQCEYWQSVDWLGQQWMGVRGGQQPRQRHFTVVIEPEMRHIGSVSNGWAIAGDDNSVVILM
jgi:hypothetical protein